MTGKGCLPAVDQTPKNCLKTQKSSSHFNGLEFSISYSCNKKGLLQTHDEFGDYTVLPSKEWGLMRLYTNFIIQGITYKEGNFIYVKPAYPDPEDGVERDFWVAKILQIRAASNQDVYALVAWLYWPEQLPQDAKPRTGRQAYHGERKAEVTRWREKDDKNRPESLYWRQTFRRETHRLSED